MAIDIFIATATATAMVVVVAVATSVTTLMTADGPNGDSHFAAHHQSSSSFLQRSGKVGNAAVLLTDFSVSLHFSIFFFFCIKRFLTSPISFPILSFPECLSWKLLSFPIEIDYA